MASFGMRRLLPIIVVIFLLTLATIFIFKKSHEEECDEWLMERGIEGYGSNFFVENYIG